MTTKLPFFAGLSFSFLCALHVCFAQDAYMQLEARTSRHNSPPELRTEDLARIDALGFLPEEYKDELLSLSQSLQVLRNGETHYCSDRLASLLQRCTKDRLATEDRDEAAMLFTLCDRGRDYPPPMECEDLRTGPGSTDKMAIKRCAMALDQHQNFQRAFDVYRILVIPEKCKSLNGIFNVDPSRDIYKNVTIELANILQALSRRESNTAEYFSQWDDRLNEFREVTADLSSTKHSLSDFNEHFVENLNGLLRVVHMTFDGLSTEALRHSEEASVELRNDMARIREEHAISLTSATTSFESLVSEGLRGIFDIAQERQNSLNLAAELSVKQLLGAIEELAMARQDFHALGVFVKEMTSKAYNQAFLLDKKQLEVSESLSELGAEIRGLTNTTQQLNDSLLTIREEAMDSLYTNDRQSDATWIKAAYSLRSLLGLLGLSPFWAFSFLVLSLPRFAVEQTMKAILWCLAFSLSFLTRVLLGHRKDSSRLDKERDAQDQLSLQTSTTPYFVYPKEKFVPQITYTTNDKVSSRVNPHAAESINQLDKLLSDWAALRSHIRLSSVSSTSASRIPTRLYAGSPERFGNTPTADAFSRTRTRRF